MPVKYLSRAEVAQRLGVAVGTLSRYSLPEPDVLIGMEAKAPIRGWLPETIDNWNANRPGKGYWRKGKND